MNIQAIWFSAIALSLSVSIHADEDIKQPDNKSWRCKLCQFEPQSEYWLGINLNFLSDDEYRFGHMNGIDEGSELFPTFYFANADGQSQRWSISFDADSLDAKRLDFNWQKFDSWQIKGSYQDYPTRQYNRLYSPYRYDGNNLTLIDSWQPLASMTQAPQLPVRNTALAGDWQNFQLHLSHITDSLDYQLDYHRIEHSGTQAISTAQMLNAFYLPMPLNQTTDNLSFSIGGLWQSLRYSLAYNVSRFNNQYDTIAFEIPYQPLVEGAEQGQMALEADNIAYKFSGNFHFAIDPTSQLKGYLAFATHKQKEPLLPYTTNNNLALSLPLTTPDLKVATRHFRLSYSKRINQPLSVFADYNYRQRDNRSTQYLFTPVINDVYVAGEINNIPYDYTKRKLTLSAKWRLKQGRFGQIKWTEDKKRRNYQYQSATRDEGFEGLLHLPLFDDQLLRFKAQRFERDGRRWQLVDLVESAQNPLLDKFTEADRKQHQYSLNYSLPLFSALDLQLGATRLENDYHNSTLGLQYTLSKQLDLSLAWQISPNTATSAFVHRQQFDSDYQAQLNALSGNWQGVSTDDLDGYGVNFNVDKLFDTPFKMKLNWYKSSGKSDLQVTSILRDERLEQVNSDWSSLTAELSYPFQQDWKVRFSYRHDRLQSSDYALDSAQPGSLKNLLSFGALSHNYQVDLFELSLTYSF